MRLIYFLERQQESTLNTCMPSLTFKMYMDLQTIPFPKNMGTDLTLYLLLQTRAFEEPLLVDRSNSSLAADWIQHYLGVQSSRFQGLVCMLPHLGRWFISSTTQLSDWSTLRNVLKFSLMPYTAKAENWGEAKQTLNYKTNCTCWNLDPAFPAQFTSCS